MYISVLYEDNHLLVVNKPYNLLSHGDDTGDITALDLGKKYIKEKYHKPGAVFLGMVHRLDRPTSGVLLMARTSKALTRLNDQMRRRKINKEYLAITAGKPRKNEEILVHFLWKDYQTNKVRVYDKKTGSANKAITGYVHLGSKDLYHLLKIKIETGKSHQIRAQLAKVGMALVGDMKYGPATKKQKLCLHAYKLGFTHPVTHENLQIIAPCPQNMPWPLFNKYCDNLE